MKCAAFLPLHPVVHADLNGIVETSVATGTGPRKNILRDAQGMSKSPSRKNGFSSHDVAEDATDEQPLLAKWSDGEAHVIFNVTVGQWRSAQSTRASAGGESGCSTFWEGEHYVTHNRLVVKRRLDREPSRLLCSGYEQQNRSPVLP